MITGQSNTRLWKSREGRPTAAARVWPQAAPSTMGCVRVTIRVRPGASRTAVGGELGGPDGESSLVVRVAARAVDGKATEAALRALADALGLRRADVSLVHGATSRTKLVEIAASPADEPALRDRLTALRQRR